MRYLSNVDELCHDASAVSHLRLRHYRSDDSLRRSSYRMENKQTMGTYGGELVEALNEEEQVWRHVLQALLVPRLLQKLCALQRTISDLAAK